MVRFATQKYSFMRKSHINAAPWLKRVGIIYCIDGSYTYFELPDNLKEYTVITPELCDKFRPVARQITARLHAISWSRMARCKEPLTEDEARNLVDIGVTIFL